VTTVGPLSTGRAAKVLLPSPASGGQARAGAIALAVAIDEQVRRLVQTHTIQMTARDCPLEQTPDERRDVLACRNLSRKLWNLVIQKPVIHPVGHFALQNILELLQVEDHAGRWVRFARHRYLEHVVMSMPVRIVAFAEDAPVLFGRERRVVVEMRSRKLNLACQINHIISGASYRDAKCPAGRSVS